MVVMVAVSFSCLPKPIWQGERYPLLELQLEIASKASSTRSTNLDHAFCGLVR